MKSFRFDDIKKKPFTDINPNGRVPAIEDPNTGLTLWESGAIYQYLVEQYDALAGHRISYTSLNERHLCSMYYLPTPPPPAVSRCLGAPERVTLGPVVKVLTRDYQTSGCTSR